MMGETRRVFSEALRQGRAAAAKADAEAAEAAERGGASSYLPPIVSGGSHSASLVRPAQPPSRGMPVARDARDARDGSRPR